MIKNILRILVLFILPLVVFAATVSTPAATKFVPNKQYKVIGSPADATNNQQVIEFFSYGCPACNHLEPAMEQWLQHIPKDVEFIRVPLTFEAGWKLYAETYYVAKALGTTMDTSKNKVNIEKKMTPLIFAAIHEQNKPLETQQAMAEFFDKHGVKKKIFLKALNHSPQVQISIGRGQALANKYKVRMIPTLIINGRYKTNLSMAKGKPKQMIAIMQYLLTKK